MKIQRELMLGAALLLLSCYGVFIEFRVGDLRSRLHELEQAQNVTMPNQGSAVSFTYAFDDSFLRHFGQEGVEAANRVARSGVTNPDQLFDKVSFELRSRVNQSRATFNRQEAL